MPCSPNTPTRRRRSSGYSIPLSASSSFMMNASGRPSHSRKSSVQSLNSPTTPFTSSLLDRSEEFSHEVNASIDANGLGSLADELAEEEWDEYGELGEDENELSSYTNGAGRNSNGLNGYAGNMQDTPLSSPRSPSTKRRRTRRRSTRSNVSGMSNESDIDESEVMGAELERQIAEIECFSKQDFSPNADASPDVFRRVEEELKDLGSQASLESHTTRLTNSLTSLTSHITSQTRQITTLTQPYTTPLSLSPSPEFIDDLLTLLTELVSSLPRPPSTPLPSINALRSTTTELMISLSVLNDSMQMDRQTATLASRRLRSSKEVVSTLQKEMNAADEGRRWLAAGGWEHKLKERQAAQICGEVVGGFEEVCESWRKRLVEAAAAAA